LHNPQVSRDSFEAAAASRENLGCSPDGTGKFDLDRLYEGGQRPVTDLSHQNHVGGRSLGKRRLGQWQE
jgi:hypothetical protein